MKKFTAGMVKDPERVDQPEGTYRDALNANLYYQKGAVVNEQGTTVIKNTGGFAIDNIIGQCPLKDGRIVLFFNYTVNALPTSAISVVDPSAKSNTIIYRNAELNFQPSNTIEATSKIDVNGEVLVYFTDNYLKRETEPNTQIEYITEYNPPRVINITRQSKSIVTRLYNNPDYTVQKLDLFMNAGYIPVFNGISIEEGGGVVSGTYHLALAYVDEDLNRTNYLVTSNPVHLVTEHEDAIPTESITGDPQGSQSNKSITWTVQIPIPSNYTHVRPVIIQRFGGGLSQESSEFAYELDIVKIPEPIDSNGFVSLDVTYTGLEQIAASSISEIVIDSVRYETAKSFVQLDNRLYISNLRARGDIGYQRFANSITISPTTTTVPKFDPKRTQAITLNTGYSHVDGEEFKNDFSIYKNLQENDINDEFFASNVRKGYKDVNMAYNYRGYRRSEVYAFYISFVLNDGTETYAYHIPGRVAKTIKQTVAENTSITDTTAISTLSTNYNLDVSEFIDLYPDAKIYQITDSQYLLDENNTEMSYWENQDEIYPETEDFETWSVDVDGNPVEVSDDLQGQKVRHHKMPPNKNDNFSFVNELDSGSQTLPLNLYGENTNYGLVLNESVKILGVILTNIPIPNFIKDQVQGFKVYYAKRTQQEKTVIGQSIVMPSWYENTIVPTYRMTTATHGPYENAWFLKGSIPWKAKSYPKIDKIPNTDRKFYRAISTFTFHDFNLLKNKHTLSGASHIDVQKVLTMRMWAGGNKKKTGENENGVGLGYFLDLDWVNSTIGNTNWYEWVDPDPDGGDDNRTDESSVDVRKVARYWTSVMIATRYNNPGYVNTAPNNSWNTDLSNHDYSYWLNNYHTVFTLDSNSKSYITGSTILKNTDSAAFKNVGYLMHYAGESCMVFSLSSGLPALHTRTSSSYNSASAAWWLEAHWSSVTNDYPELSDVNVDIGDKKFQGFPTLFLVNLCAYKTNVYKPFDQQRLVWTGYYQPISSDRDRDLEKQVDAGNPNIYKTDTIFGGDTYVSRYSFRTTSQDYGSSFFHANYSDDKSNVENWSTTSLANNYNTDLTPYQTTDPFATVFQFLCESDDLLGFRHQGDTSEGVTVDESIFFDGSIGADVLFNAPQNDNTKSENLLYMNNYSAVQDIKVTAPLPKKLFNPTFYPTRTIRSTVDDGSIQDKYRFFLALDYKDIPRNRGEITKVFTLGSILYLHTERSLFVTRGRQQLGLSDNTQAFVGSGDIFEQNPDEMIPTTEGYGGTDCQFASLTTRFGQFFVNRRDRKVYMMSENIEELSSLGMEKWFLDNLPYQLESYIDLGDNINFDSPTEHFGFNATYDPKYKRIILSKKELIPSKFLIDTFTGGANISIKVTEAGLIITGDVIGGEIIADFTDKTYFTPDGWTVSYYPEIKVWGSRHSYLPAIFANNQREYYSIVNGSGTNVWEHSDLNNPGNFYDTTYNFEFEYIDNSQVGQPKVFSTLRYWAEVVSPKGTGQTLTMDKATSPGFTEFFVYNSTQLSEQKEIYYLTNARLVNNFWYINEFRDMSRYELNTSNVLANGQLNVQDAFNQGSTTISPTTSMFTEEGVINNAYIDTNKSWYNQKRFVDHYLGVRLISDNLERNLIYLYSAGTKFRQSFR